MNFHLHQVSIRGTPVISPPPALSPSPPLPSPPCRSTAPLSIRNPTSPLRTPTSHPPPSAPCRSAASLSHCCGGEEIPPPSLLPPGLLPPSPSPASVRYEERGVGRGDQRAWWPAWWRPARRGLFPWAPAAWTVGGTQIRASSGRRSTGDYALASDLRPARPKANQRCGRGTPWRR